MPTLAANLAAAKGERTRQYFLTLMMFNFFEMKLSDQYWGIVTRAVASRFRGYLNSEPRGSRYKYIGTVTG